MSIVTRRRGGRLRTACYPAALLVDAVGTGLYLPLTVLFIQQVTELSLLQVGAGLSAAAAIGLLANPLAGWLVDRVGPRTVLIGSYLVRAVGFAGYLVAGDMASFVAVAALIAAGDRAFYPANAAYVAAMAAGRTRDRFYATVGTLRSVGFAAGGLLTATAVSLPGVAGYHLLAALNAASFVAAAGLLVAAQAPGPDADPADSDAADFTGRAGYRAVLTDRPFLALVGIELVFTLVHAVFPVVLPVYVVTILHAPAALLGVIFALNTAGLALGRLPVLALQRRSRRTHAMALAGGVFVASFALFAGAATVPAGLAVSAALVSAAVVFTLAELMHSTPSMSLAAGVAPPSSRGRYLAVHQLTWGVSTTVAPLTVTALLATRPHALWLGLGVTVTAASLALLALYQRLPTAATHPEQ